MSRPIWKGSIAFGLVNIPVKLYSGEERKAEVHFNLLDKRDQAHIKFKRVNEVTGKEVTWDNIIKGYEIEKDEYVLLEDKDFEALAVENNKAIEISELVPEAEIAPHYFEKPYYLIPDKSGLKGYALLRETLKELKHVGIAKMVIRSGQSLVCLRPYEDTLQLIVLRYQEEIREPEQIDFPTAELKKTRISEKELEIASQLVEAMAGKWKPDSYHDEYHEALKAYVEKKHKEGDNFRPPEPEEEKPSKSVDLMELLQKSLSGRKIAPTAKGSKKAHR